MVEHLKNVTDCTSYLSSQRKHSHILGFCLSGGTPVHQIVDSELLKSKPCVSSFVKWSLVFFFHGHYFNWQRSSSTKTQFGNHPYLPTKSWSDMGKYFNRKKCWFTNKGWLTQFLSWTHLLGGKSLVISEHANKCPSLLSRLAKPCQHNKETELSCQSDTCK